MKNKKNVPDIRFKGFDEEWKENYLHEVINLKSGKDYKHLPDGNIPVYGTGGFMLNVNEALSYNCNGIGIGRKGTIDKPYILYAPFWTVDTLFYALPKDNNDLDFIFDIFQKIDWRSKDESTGVPSLSKVAITSTRICTTEFIEQQAIGNYFQNIDRLINTNQTKLDKLKNIKKACLEKMFPRNGSTTPELRFKGFSEEWEEKEMSIVAIFNPKSELPEVFEYVDLESVVGTEMISHREESKLTAPSRAQRLAKQGDLFYQTVRPYQRNNHLFDKDIDNYVFSTGYVQLRPYGNGYFLLSLVQGELFVKTVLDNCTGTSYPAISSTDLAKIKVSIPKYDEQKTIGSLFKNLDILIAKTEQQINKLKNIKKAFLDKMFVNTEDKI